MKAESPNFDCEIKERNSMSGSPGNFNAALAEYQTALAEYTAGKTRLHLEHVKLLALNKDGLCAETAAVLAAANGADRLDEAILRGKLAEYDLKLAAQHVDARALRALIEAIQKQKQELANLRQALEAARKKLDAALARAEADADATVAAMQAFLAGTP
ncbi:MAG: hypothetical protein K2W82_18100 [Candidatus Obscuribacterales bacterium]|nr:hypothetical protein [Candidatus Obscuribacterales bacterium]